MYDSTILEHSRHPRNRDELPDAQAAGDAVNSLCGDVIRVELTIADGMIAKAGFTGDACAVCVASASMLTDIIPGRRYSDLRDASDDDLLAASGAQFPDGRRRCATLPGDAVRRALGARDARRSGGITGLLLAAGSARRFGGSKLIAEIGGEPVIRRAALAIAGSVDRLIVVTDSEGSPIVDALDGIPCTIVINDRAHEGMGTSIAAGVLADIDQPDALMIALGDQPFVSPRVIRAVRDAWRSPTEHPAIVAPLYQGARGHPVLFDRAVFSELISLSGDRGARDIIDRDPMRVVAIPIATLPPGDVDTTDDLAGLRRDLDGATRASDG